MPTISRRPARAASASLGAIALCACLAGSAYGAIGDISTFPVPTPNSQPTGIGAAPDGSIWFTEGDFAFGNKIGKITNSGSITEFLLPTPNAQPTYIAPGPDGNMWFVEYAANKVGTITPSGSVTEYVPPTANSQPVSITAGPDGNMWFTESGANKIGRITMSGEITEFPIPSPSSFTQIIARGPDGNMWFTESGANKIGRITMSGEITEFPIPTPNPGPVGIAAGPDGNMWVAEAVGNKIAKVSMAGAFTEYELPAANSAPFGITGGPDGNMWFTERLGNRVASITMAGKITEYPLSDPPTDPLILTAGTDGAVWFAESDANNIARVETGSLLTITRSGSGSGTVTSEPAGISCGSACSAIFLPGLSVTVSAAPSSDSLFAGWEGECSGSSTSCTVKMPLQGTVTAKFEKSNRFTISSSTPVGNSLRTRGRVPGPGKLGQRALIAGSRRAACKASKSLSRGGRFTVGCRLNSAARARRTKGALRLVVTTTYTPTGGTPRSIRRTVVFRALSPRWSG